MSRRNDDMVSKMNSQMNVDYKNAVKKGKKFAKYIREKFGDSQYPLSQLLAKAHQLKKKFGLNDAEFNVFKATYERDLANRNPEERRPETILGRLLGNNIYDDRKGVNVSEGDYKYLQEIMKLHSSSKELHSKIVLQHFQYKDLDLQALTGTYDRRFNQVAQAHVHPVLAALFLPKIKSLDQHFLLANIAGVVTARHNRQKLQTLPDYELLYYLTTDPNDVVCSSKSPVQDLLARANLQNQLWNCVLHLRNGQYYNNMFGEFIKSVDMCRINKYDQPDLVYGRHDGTILKRIFAAFSFRPTVVATYPVTNNLSNPYHINLRPSVRTISTINLKLSPLNLVANVGLNSAVQQQQFFYENGVLVPRLTELIYSRNVLVFYIDRSSVVMRMNPMYHVNLINRPVAIEGFERVSTRAVSYQNVMNIRGDTYELRSVVCQEVNSRVQANENIVVGSNAMLVRKADLAVNPAREYYLYDPLGVNRQIRRNNGFVSNAPITTLQPAPGAGVANDSFRSRAENHGVIFIYELTNDTTQGVLNT